MKAKTGISEKRCERERERAEENNNNKKKIFDPSRPDSNLSAFEQHSLLRWPDTSHILPGSSCESLAAAASADVLAVFQ